MPGPNDKRKNKADQIIIKKVEHIADNSRKDDLFLIERQLLLAFEQFQHHGLPTTGGAP